MKTWLAYMFPLAGRTKQESIEAAVKSMVTGREGIFVLTSNRNISAEKILNYYRDRNKIETAFKDLKHEIDWRPARCSSEMAIRGRILVSFLALFCISMIRFLYSEYKNKTAETIIEELSSFSVTIIRHSDNSIQRIFSNFGRLIRQLRDNSSQKLAKIKGNSPSLESFLT